MIKKEIARMDNLFFIKIVGRKPLLTPAPAAQRS